MNNLGITGINWNAKILPVRVLGKCGGYTSDVIDGMIWSSGLSVPGVPSNANPAKVLNLSLNGYYGYGDCSSIQQDAINQIVAVGSIIVVGAGNSNQGVAGFANCNGVISVAAISRWGNKAYYSNFGSQIKVSAPGGAQTDFNDPNGILSTLDTGTASPDHSHTYLYYQGTSQAASHVSGVASLIVGLRPDFTSAQVLSLLQNTARAFPSGSTCNTNICGSGIVDASLALTELINSLPPSAPILNAIVNTDGDGNYTISWDSVNNATGYTLEEATDNTTFAVA